MTENENLEKKIADDLSAVLKEAKAMGCKEVACFRHIPLQNVEAVIQDLEEIKQYRAIGTVEGYERAIASSIENYNLYREYKSKVQEFEAIGTIDEFKTLKEKNTPKKPFGGMYNWTCPTCGTYHSTHGKCCSECMQMILWD